MLHLDCSTKIESPAGLRSGNQTWQWKKKSMIFPWKPPCLGGFPLPCLIYLAVYVMIMTATGTMPSTARSGSQNAAGNLFQMQPFGQTTSDGPRLSGRWVTLHSMGPLSHSARPMVIDSPWPSILLDPVTRRSQTRVSKTCKTPTHI